MKVQFLSPSGRVNQADLTSEQIEWLKADKDYQVMDIKSEFDFELPTMEPVMVRPRIHISDSACTSCEG